MTERRTHLEFSIITTSRRCARGAGVSLRGAFAFTWQRAAIQPPAEAKTAHCISHLIGILSNLVTVALGFSIAIYIVTCLERTTSLPVQYWAVLLTLLAGAMAVNPR